MTDLINLSISALLKKLFDDDKPLDFDFLEYIDPTTNVKKVHCPLHDTVGCNANFPALNNSKDLFNFFDHIYRSHPNDRESIKTDYDKRYQEKKNLWSRLPSSLTTADIVTSHDIEDLFEPSSTRPTTTTYNQVGMQRANSGGRVVVVVNLSGNFLVHYRVLNMPVNGWWHEWTLNYDVKVDYNQVHLDLAEREANILVWFGENWQPTASESQPDSSVESTPDNIRIQQKQILKIRNFFFHK